MTSPFSNANYNNNSNLFLDATDIFPEAHLKRLFTQDNLTTYLILAGNLCVVFFSYLVVIDEDEPVVNQSIVQEVVEASQRSFSQDLCKSTQLQIISLLMQTRARAYLWSCNMTLPGSDGLSPGGNAISLATPTPPHSYPIPPHPQHFVWLTYQLAGIHLYSPGWIEALWEESIFPKNTTQLPQ